MKRMLARYRGRTELAAPKYAKRVAVTVQVAGAALKRVFYR